eukprot:CAMPEP_0174735350 /NCGR_PEP_ID=MMETSP1094-20130205/64829_1 /TAXON_ID=156173 /ORGANISM="Chrysochromulina brevifilum, Strain UTEX LB 985" /LENGTH=152 /DNA_ID=CAMNT_0015938305 /DNA_START=8 /DNA_END=463 /DNA_ORIENTATION=-
MEGVGCDRVTDNFAAAAIDAAFSISDEQSVKMAQHLLREDGLFVGGSAAMNAVAAVRAARRLGPGHTIVTVLCDGGQRYLSSVHATSEETPRAEVSSCGDDESPLPLQLDDATLARFWSTALTNTRYPSMPHHNWAQVASWAFWFWGAVVRA